MPKIYSARWVLPIISPAIDYGAVAVDDSVIIAVGPLAEVTAAFPHTTHENFGNAAILPGLVNTHSHLELTVMRGFLEREEHDFFAWLKKLTVARLKMTDEDLFVSAACGAIEAARAGITCLGDSSSFARQSMCALRKVGLRGIVYQESFGPDPNLASENMAKLLAQIDLAETQQTDLVQAGVSPHAPYTVCAPQLEMISRLAIDEKLPLMMHAAESKAEAEFMLTGSGPFADGLKARGIGWTAPGISTVKYLSDHGVLDTRPLLAHCINVDDQDLELIKQAGAGIAHCPKSNAKLRHGHAPFAQFLVQGINVGLGSDSVASNNLSDILEEARFATLMARTTWTDTTGSPTGIKATAALFAATLGGARAMGLEDRVGSLRAGMHADLAIVDLSGTHQQPVRDPQDALAFSSSGQDVVLTLVSGREVYRDGRMTTVDEADLSDQLTAVSGRLAV
jgi:cytosine/adenosine deaminase-related metal-dependent hydrolase